MGDAPIFDMTKLMAATCDDLELAGQVAEVFLCDLPEQLDSLDAALAAGDAGVAERVAHTIKGAAATVGGEALRDVAFECEAFGRDGELSRLKAMMPELRRQFALLRESLMAADFVGKE